MEIKKIRYSGKRNGVVFFVCSKLLKMIFKCTRKLTDLVNNKETYFCTKCVQLHLEFISIQYLQFNAINQTTTTIITFFLSISSPRLYQVLTTVFGLQVKYNGQYNVDVALPKTYQGIMCGLCGNMDDDGSAGDEFVNADFDVVNFES